MHLGDLERDLQQKLAAERAQIEQIHKAELDKLKQNLHQEYSSAFSTIKADTVELKQKIQAMHKWYLLLPGLIVTSLLIGSSIGSWAMSRSLANQLQQIQEQQNALNQLNQKTWGVELYQTDKGRFIILPSNSQYPTDWKCKNKPCLKL